MRYGGSTQYGGMSRYGGAQNIWLIYYQILKSIAFPGLHPQDDEAIINKLLRVDSKGLDHGKTHVITLFKEIFPHTAFETLDEWATLLGIIFGVTDTVQQKRDANVAKWRGSQGSSLKAIRNALVDLLKPAVGFLETFDCTSFGLRFEFDGNGTRNTGGGFGTLVVTNPTQATWDGTTLSPTANRVFIRLPDLDDDWQFDAENISASAGAGAATGLFVMESAIDATHFVIGDAGGPDELRIDRISGGVLTEDLDSLAIAAPAFSIFQRIERIGNELVFSNGASFTTLTEFHRESLQYRPRFVGFFARNAAAGFTTVSIGIEAFQLTMATQVNNVEIIELTNALASLSTPVNVFRFYVHRDPADAGVADIKNAQRALDTMAQAHTLGRVVESVHFKMDDPASLTDRDLLGC